VYPEKQQYHKTLTINILICLIGRNRSIVYGGFIDYQGVFTPLIFPYLYLFAAAIFYRISRSISALRAQGFILSQDEFPVPFVCLLL